MSNMIKNLIKSLAILSVFLTTPFIGIEPSQAYTEDGQPTTIEECKEKKQEAKNMAGDSYAEYIYENCLNSDNTPKYGSQSNEQSNNPEDPSNEVQSETIIVPAEELNSLPIPEETEKAEKNPETKEDCEELKKETLNNYPYASNNYADWVYKNCMQEIGQEPQSETPSQDTPTSSPTEHCRYFLGMVSWDCNVSLLNQDENISQDDLGSSIWTIAANIATDITVIAAYLVVGYIIYGGYLYIFSAGDTNKTVTGKKAIHQALFGLAIVLSANIILNGIRIGLVGGGFSNCVTNECIEPADMVKNALEWVIGISGAVSAIFIVYGGTSYTMSRGDANKVQTAKQIITYALIGMIIVTLAELIVIFASNIINSANNTAYLDTNQISIIKEYHET